MNLEQWWRSIGSPKTCAAVIAAWRAAGQPGNNSASARRWSTVWRAATARQGGCPMPGGMPSVGFTFADRGVLMTLMAGQTQTPAPKTPAPTSPPPTSGTPPPRGGPPQTPQADFGDKLREFWNKINGLIGSGEVCGFAKSAKTMAAQAATKDDWMGVAQSAGGFFVYSNSGTSGGWKVPTCRLGQDRLADDPEYPPEFEVTGAMTVTDFIRAYGGAGGGNGVKTPTGQPSSPATGAVVRGLQGVRAQVAQKWQCPRGYVQGDPAIFGAPSGVWGRPGTTVEDEIPLCFAKDILPEKFRASKPRTAAVSHSDKENIRKAKRAINRIKTYARTSGIVAAPRRRRRTESHYHHTHRR